MKFRRNKIKREHSIIKGTLDWLEELSKHREITDIIPGVIDITNSKERGIFFQYETPTGCKLLLKSGGVIQEAFVVTKKPQVVQAWINKTMEELDLFQAALNNTVPEKHKKEQIEKSHKQGSIRSQKTTNSGIEQSKDLLITRDGLLSGIKEDFQLVEINQGLRDSLLESFATMADFDNPKIEDTLDSSVRDALENLQKK